MGFLRSGGERPRKPRFSLGAPGRDLLFLRAAQVVSPVFHRCDGPVSGLAGMESPPSHGGRPQWLLAILHLHTVAGAAPAWNRLPEHPFAAGS